jgi:hypothetical protein
MYCLDILPLEEEDKVLVFGENFGNFSISGFEMVLTRYVSTYIITYYLPSGTRLPTIISLTYHNPNLGGRGGIDFRKLWNYYN